jgi:hypothetical protein
MPLRRDLSLADLEGLERDGLVALWSELHGRPAPRAISRPMMIRILAFELQARAEGGLSKPLLKALASLAGEKPAATTRKTAKLRPGARLIREWAGVTHVVDVTADGYLWRGEAWRSLSAIARAITGAHWSGPRFFGTVATDTSGTNRVRRTTAP